MISEILNQIPTSTILVIVSFLLCLIIYQLFRASSTPGPWGIPYFGYYPFLENKIHLQFQKLAKKYGDVFSINICGQEHFHLSSMKAHREVHINQSDVFIDRHEDNFAVNIFGNGKGIIGLQGEAWRLQRKHFLQNMREIGLSATNDQLKGPVEEAVQSTLLSLRKYRGKVVDLIPILTRACIDPVVKLYLGNDVAEEQIEKMNNDFIKMMEPISNCNILLTGKTANFLIAPLMSGYSDMMSSLKSLTATLQSIVDQHKATFDKEQPPRDFIDSYLLEKMIREKKKDPCTKFFSDESLVGTLIQVYGDGTSSVGILVATFLKALSSHTDVQDKIHEEIIQAVGSERLPTLDDKPQLPFLLSTMKELFRTTELFPVLPGLKCTRNTTVMGVDIPDDAVTILDIYAANHDPDVYEDPYTFDAHRFMPNKPKVDQPLNFGMGRRACAGEGLVVAELFLFMAGILQNYLILPDYDDEKSCTNDSSIKYERYDVMPVPRARGRFNSATGNA